jgi:hypothetical protein
MTIVNKAVEVLEAERARIRSKADEEIKTLDEHIARIKNWEMEKTEENVGGEFPEVRPGQFSQMDPHTALRVYLNDRKGGPVRIARAAVDIALGGASLGRPERHERNLKIMISNNSKDFTYGDDEKNTVQLTRGLHKRGK